MGRQKFYLVFVAVCLLLTGCALGEETEPDLVGAYQQVLRGNQTFMYNGEVCYLNEASAGLVEETPIFRQIAVADLDADGMPEVVISIDLENFQDFGFIVLDWHDGMVSGYDFVLRALLRLKTDGTFSYSSGAADNGFGYASFENGIAEIIPIAYSETLFDGSVVGYVDGEAVTEDEFLDAALIQEAKEDVQWFDFDGADLSVIFDQ